MDATREDLVQCISAIRSTLHGRNGLVGEPVQAETLDQLTWQVARLMTSQKVNADLVVYLKTQVEDLSHSIVTTDS